MVSISLGNQIYVKVINEYAYWFISDTNLKISLTIVNLRVYIPFLIVRFFFHAVSILSYDWKYTVNMLLALWISKTGRASLRRPFFHFYIFFFFIFALKVF